MNRNSQGISGRQNSPAPTSASSSSRNADLDFELTREDASLEARKAGFTQLKALAGQHASSDKRHMYFEIITTPVDPSLADLQIDALEHLITNGQSLVPFESQVVTFLNRSLDQLFIVTEKSRETKSSSEADENVWAGQLPSTGKQQSKSEGGVGPSKEPAGAERAFLDIFYLIEKVLMAHSHAFQGDQIHILLDSVANITKRTTMRRALRGSLKIFLAATTRIRLPDADFKSSILALCSIFGNATFKFHHEAWEPLNVLLKSEDCQAVGDVLLGLLSSPPNPTDLRKVAKFRGALLAVEKLSEDNDLLRSVNPDLIALVGGLANAFGLSEQLNLHVLRTVRALLSDDLTVQHFSAANWELLRPLLDRADCWTDENTGQSAISPAVHKLQANLSTASDFHGFVRGNSLRKIETQVDEEKLLQEIANKLLFLMESPWQTLAKEKSLLILRLLLHIGQRISSLNIQIISKMVDANLFNPECQDWSFHLDMMVELMSLNESPSDASLCAIIEVLHQLYPLFQHSTSLQSYEEYVVSFCDERIGVGVKASPMQASTRMANLAADIGVQSSFQTFEGLLKFFEGALGQRNDTTVLDPFGSLCNSLISLFLRCHQESGPKAARVYQLCCRIIHTVDSTSRKLRTVKLLTRLRCRADFAISIATLPNPEELTVNLWRPILRSGKSDSTRSASKRVSTYVLHDQPRAGRSSTIERGSGPRSRSATRSVNAKDQRQAIILPSWVYDESILELPISPPSDSRSAVYAGSLDQERTEQEPLVIDLCIWLDFQIEILKKSKEWELYSYVLVHLPIQLSNCSLFSRHVKSLQILHSTIVQQLHDGDFVEPPSESGIKKGDVALCLYQILINLLPYHGSFSRRMTDETIRTFRMGIEKWDRTGKSCIHALALCCFELPQSVERQIVGITEMMQKRITQADLAMDILEFLGCLSSIRPAFGDADAAFYRRIFGICIRYLQYTWEQRQKSGEGARHRGSFQLNRQSGSSSDLTRAPIPSSSPDSHGLAEYVFTIAYQAIIFWFLSIDIRERAQHVGWLTQELSWKDEYGKEHIQEQSLVILDMMHRTVFSNLGETEPHYAFIDSETNKVKRTWLVGMSIVTAELIIDKDSATSGCGQLTKRQASGTTHATYYHNTAKLPSHHVGDESENTRSDPGQPLDLYPNHMFLQMNSSISPVPTPCQPIPLPEDDFTTRAIKVFDAIDTVDGHKAGVIYIGHNQTSEGDILSSSAGSDAYEAFVSGLGTKVSLKGAKFNTQGLDRLADEDGSHAVAWRNRTTEIVFHVATMMPTDPTDDPQCDKKKRHIGNDHVKIIFNESRSNFDFHTISTSMNAVNIIITPEAHAGGSPPKTDQSSVHSTASTVQNPSDTDLYSYYKVQTLSSPEYPDITFAARPKMVSAEVLPAFVRQIAINASVFCQVWGNKEGEYISCWRARLQEIIRLRKRYIDTKASANVHYPMASSEPTSSHAEGDKWSGNIALGGIADSEKLLHSMDFTRWT